jgi:serine/threonine protein kinase
MGAVYKAWDNVLRMSVAVKVMCLPASSDTAVARFEERFRRELRLARQVTHKNVVRIHDIGEIDGIKYITMPYVKGSDLASILTYADKLPVRRVLLIARQIAEGLEAAHEAGVVHRDLKPANIMIDVKDHVLVMDFGLARSVAVAAPEDTESISDASMVRPSEVGTPPSDPTMAGVVIGTVAYMAPEQARGGPVDHRADIYAFGLLLRQMLLGGRYKGHPPDMTVAKLAALEKPPKSLRRVEPGIPVELDRLVLRCLQPDVEQRYPSMAEVISDLEQISVAGRIFRRSRTWMWISAVALVVLAVVFSLQQFWPSEAEEKTEPVEPPWISLNVVTDPHGASVRLDGRWLSEETPLEVSLSPLDEHELILSKEGYDTETLRIVPGEVLPSAEVKLTPIRYGTLSMLSPYELSVLSMDGTILIASGINPTGRMQSGEHQARLYAPQVFLDRPFTVRIRPDERTIIEAPHLGKVSVRAVPSNCELFINGVPSEALPIFSKDIVVGTHQFVFKWPGGKRQERRHEVKRGQHTYVTGQLR